MRIAVNTIFLQKNNLEGYGYFVQEIFRRLAAKYVEHEFIFLFDRAYDEQFIFSANIKPIVIKPKARHALAFKFWYDVKLAWALRSIKPDVVVQPYGFCSLTTKFPQLLIVHDLAFIHYPKFIGKQHLLYYKKFTPKFLQKAKQIATVSEFSKQDIINQYKIPSEKISVVYSAAKPLFTTIPYVLQSAVKEKYTNGCEYFLFTGGIHPRKNLLTLLKAFSVFKKRQQSNMKLLIAGRLAWQNNDFLDKLETYKYKSDIVLLGYINEDELAHITASAYTLIFPSFFEGFGVPPLEAMQCNVPVITSNVSSMPEICGTAALYANPNNYNELAEKMMQLYKDETLRNNIIDEGKQQYKKFTWDITANLMWQSILKTMA
ncbi:MAG: glycosyltransferase family 4 protein [Bacteroidetes bacterium]|nr:glycosyltransferase family 4 protein [Bacteroidota bacterium]MBS1649408.1 glycosyltransferase family 4 protein [Bacteroidota bacterium]